MQLSKVLHHCFKIGFHDLIYIVGSLGGKLEWWHSPSSMIELSVAEANDTNCPPKDVDILARNIGWTEFAYIGSYNNLRNASIFTSAFSFSFQFACNFSASHDVIRVERKSVEAAGVHPAHVPYPGQCSTTSLLPLGLKKLTCDEGRCHSRHRSSIRN